VSLQPVLDLGRLVLSFQGHAQLDTYLSACHRGRYLHNLQHTQGMNVYALRDIRTHDPSNLASEGLSLDRTSTGTDTAPLAHQCLFSRVLRPWM
jgi:hypothetical protein